MKNTTFIYANLYMYILSRRQVIFYLQIPNQKQDGPSNNKIIEVRRHNATIKTAHTKYDVCNYK